VQYAIAIDRALGAWRRG